jgi:hypothetical protein
VIDNELFLNVLEYAFKATFFFFIANLVLMFFVRGGFRMVTSFWVRFWFLAIKIALKILNRVLTLNLTNRRYRECFKSFKRDFKKFLNTSNYPNKSDEEILNHIMNENPKLFWDVYIRYEKKYFANKRMNEFKYKANDCPNIFI